MALKQRKPREPDDEDIVDALKAAVTDARASGKLAELSVKAGRTYAEEKLGLSAGFLKSNTSWTARSKQILQDAIVLPPTTAICMIAEERHRIMRSPHRLHQSLATIIPPYHQY